MNIVITGASKGIGFAIAKTFALQDEIHSIGICSRHQEEIEKAESELRAISPKHKYFAKVCDISQENDVNAFVSEYEQQFGVIDALINNAGFGIFKPVLELSKLEFESVLATNLRGVFLFTRAAIAKMKERKKGTIITISSLSGKHGFKGGTAYCASKFAVRGFMQCLFLEARSDNIRFVTIFPGTVRTDFFASAEYSTEAKIDRMLTPNDVARCVESALRLPQSADISEIDIRPTNPKG